MTTSHWQTWSPRLSLRLPDSEALALPVTFWHSTGTQDPSVGQLYSRALGSGKIPSTDSEVKLFEFKFISSWTQLQKVTAIANQGQLFYFCQRHRRASRD